MGYGLVYLLRLNSWGRFYCWLLVGDPDAQGDGRNPQVNQQDVGGLRGEEKWRPDRVGTPEAGEIWRCRQEGPSERNGRGVEGDRLAHSSPGSLLGSQVRSAAL